MEIDNLTPDSGSALKTALDINTENPNLRYYWNLKVGDLTKSEDYTIDEGMQERHRLYSLLLMAITRYYWNGNKKGRNGEYPLNPKKTQTSNKDELNFANNDYQGHNIASIAVDALGNVIDFEFNHNKLFNSSAEHAEARMVKRVYSLAQIHDSWEVSLDNSKSRDDYNTFEDVTLYTTLESCSQCAGIMALARVKEVVYLQTDPGMYLIGNILRNLTRPIKEIPGSTGTLQSPMPISGKDFDLSYFQKLNEAYAKFPATLKETPFFKPEGKDKDPKLKDDVSPSITSFLCTKSAYDIYNEAYTEFTSLTPFKLKNPGYKPHKGEAVIENAKTNAEVLHEITSFYHYATKSGKRGTPHK